MQAVEVSTSGNTWLHDLVRSSQRYSADRSLAASSAHLGAGGVHTASMPDLSDVPEQAGPLPQHVYESTIDLSKGGKTHQIRAQLAAVGAPVIGDVMYGPIAGITVAAGGTAGEELVRRTGQSQQIEGCIGLHAFRLVWDGRTYETLPPWRVQH